MTEYFAKINGIKLCYEISGEGEPLILVHGYQSKKENWLSLYGTLSEKFKVIRFDNRTSGKSDRPDKPITMDVFSDDIKGLMDYLKIKKAHIAGSSLGGMICQAFVLKYPEYVNKLILICTNYSGVMGEIIISNSVKGLEERKKDPVKAFWDSAPFEYHVKIRKQMKSNPKKRFYGIWSVEDLIKRNTIDPPTIKDLINQGHAFKDFNTFKRLGEIKSKTLLIAASHDRILPNSQLFEMNEVIQNSTLKIINKAGHAVCTSNAPEVSKCILDFLEK